MTAIYKRELKSYFDTMIGFVFIAFIVAAMGIYFFVYNMSGGYPYFSATLTGTLFVLLISIPVLTMKCLADEKRSKTDQLLLTAPISLTKIILGKYFAMVTIFAIPVLISCLCPLIIKANGTAYLFNDYASILAFFLMGCVYIAIGMFISSLTESQIIAAVGTFGILFLLQLWPDLIAYLPSTAAASFIGFIVIVLLIALIINSMTKNWLISSIIGLGGVFILLITYISNANLFDNALSQLLSKITFIDTLYNFTSNQLFDVTGLIYFISAIFVFIFLTIQTVQKRRWS